MPSSDHHRPRASRAPQLGAGAVPGRWVAAGTLIAARYPCRCAQDQRCRPKRCPCDGRTDAAEMPSRCCARRAYDTAQRTKENE